MSATSPRAVHAERSLGDLVAELPARSRVLERAGLDYCCKGHRSLAEAAADAGLDVAALAAEMSAVTDTSDLDIDSLAPLELVEHLVSTHHDYLHEELPALVALVGKVDAAHRARHPELQRVASLVAALRAELEPHLVKEEQVLFPAIEELVANGPGGRPAALAAPLRVMLLEHDRAGELLADLRAASSGYSIPGDACTSYRALYERLATLEADTHRHIHLENNVLFPAVDALDAGAG